MKFKFLILGLALLAVAISQEGDVKKVTTESLQIGKQQLDQLNENQRIAYYLVDLEEIIPDENFIVIVKSTTPYGDPDVRLAFKLEDLLITTDDFPEGKVYKCQSLGREICIIPYEDLAPKRRSKDANQVFIEVTQKETDVLEYLIEVEYEVKKVYQFGSEYTINLDSDMVKQFTLKFDKNLKEGQSISSIFASIVPLQEGMIEDKIEFYAVLGTKQIQGIEIWERGLGMFVHNKFFQGSSIIFQIVASSRMAFSFKTISPQYNVPLELNQKEKGYLFTNGSTIYSLDLSKVKNHKEMDLFINYHPYFGQSNLEVKALQNFDDAQNPEANWAYNGWGNEQIVIKAKDRLDVNREDNTYYIRVKGLTELTYSLKVYMFDKDKLTINLHDTMVGTNNKDEITNYLLKVVTLDIIQVRVMLFNLQSSDNDIFIKKCQNKAQNCLVTPADILEYENDLRDNKQNTNFVAAKTGDRKQEFLSFTHEGVCDDFNNSACKYMIAVKGIYDGQNKYSLRVNSDAEHIMLQNNIPYKDNIKKHNFNFYKYISPSIADIKQIDFIITTFLGHVNARSSRENKYPRRDGYEQFTNESQVISYKKKEYKNLKETTFFIGVQGTIDSIYTITPHLIFETEQNETDPGILIFDGIKQDINFSMEKTTQYFHVKVPFENGKTPKFSINIYSGAGAFKIFLDLDQNVLQKDPNQAAYSNSDVNNQITIPEQTFERGVILYGVIYPLTEIKVKEEERIVTLYYHTDFIDFEFELNKSNTQFFHKKQPQHFSFEIKEYSNYYISVLTNASNQYKLQFYVSLNQRVNRPSQDVNNASFKAFEGFSIDKSLLDDYCPQLREKVSTLSTKLSCYVYITGYAFADIMSTITITNEDAIYHVYEGIPFKTQVPLPKKFSYFITEVLPQTQFTKIEVNSNAVHLQIYASVYMPDIYEQQNMMTKKEFPTSQNSQFQSILDIFNDGTTSIQISTIDNKQCEIYGCKILIVIDNLDKKFVRGGDNYMELLVTNEKTIIELIEGKDYQIPQQRYGINYFKYVVGEEIKSFKVELLGIQSSNEDYEYLNLIVVSNDTSALPTQQKNQYADSLSNSLEVLPLKFKGQKYLQPGMYYIGVLISYVDNPVYVRLTTNQQQIINLSLDGQQRQVALEKSDVVYALIDLHQIQDDIPFELLVLNPQSEFSIKVFSNQVFQRITGIREIEEVVKDNLVVAQLTKEIHRIKFVSKQKNSYHYIIQITSQKYQTLNFILRTKNTVQKINQNTYFKDVLLPQKERIFDLQYSKNVIRISIFSGEISISTLPPRNSDTVQNWIAKKEFLMNIQYDSSLSSNVIELALDQNEAQANRQNVILFIENQSNGEAFYFIENTYISKGDNRYKKKVLLTGHPHSGRLQVSETVSYIIQNFALTKSVFKLSIFYPSLHLREQLGEKIKLPQILISPINGENSITFKDHKKTSSQQYFELVLNSGQYEVNITRSADDFSLGHIDNEYRNELEYIISLDTFGINHLINDVKYYQKSDSRTQLALFEYFREWGTPFVVEIFDCLGDTSLALSESLSAVKSFSSDLIMRSKSIGPYKYYTFSTFEEIQQNEKDVENKDLNFDDFASSSVLYIAAKTQEFDSHYKRSEYILRVSSFPTNNEALTLPFEYFYTKRDSIFVAEIQTKEGKGFRFSTSNVRCEDDCRHIRAKINYVIYELYITNMDSALQEYSVCHTNMTDYKNLSLTYFPEAISTNSGYLVLRKAIKSNGLAIKSDVQPVFEVSLKEFNARPQQIYYSIVATVNILEFGGQKAQNIPIFYQKQKIEGRWWEKCVECEKMSKHNEVIVDINKEKEESEESSSSSVAFILLILILSALALFAIYKALIYCKNKGNYSLQKILSSSSNSHHELNEYHSYA